MTSIILDIHHHGASAPENAVTSFSLGEPVPQGNGALSVGIHPWHTENGASAFPMLEQVIAENPRIVAIGETGLDLLRGATLETQTEIFRRHVELSERLGMPLIIHSVRAIHLILQLHKELSPRQNWAIHGFRGNPTQAQQLTSRGIYLSYGERFYTESLAVTPVDFILAETDESPKSITEIIAALSPFITTETIARNTSHFLQRQLTE